MSIAVTCPSCSAQFTAPDEAAGKRTRCPKCGGAIAVPVPPRPLATQKQKDYARELGIQFPPNIDRHAISKLIDEAVAKRDNERFDRLQDLERREAVAAEGLRLQDATTEEIMTALCDRGLCGVLITMERNKIEDFEHLIGLSATWSYTEENMGQHDMESMILSTAATIMDKRFK